MARCGAPGVTRDEVIGAVLRHFGVARRNWLADRARKTSCCRGQVAMYLLRAETDASLLEIGGELGGRDHTTVLHGIKQIERSLGSDASLRAQVLAIKESLVVGHGWLIERQSGRVDGPTLVGWLDR